MILFIISIVITGGVSTDMGSISRNTVSRRKELDSGYERCIFSHKMSFCNFDR